MSVSERELEAIVRRIVGEAMSQGVSHRHEKIDKHYAECPDCGTRNPEFHPDQVCENCDKPVYTEDPKCPWCGGTKARSLTKDDVDRLYGHLHRIRG